MEYYRLWTPARQLNIDPMRRGLQALAILLVSCSAPPDPPPDPKLREGIDTAAQSLLRSGKYVGLVVGVIHHGRPHVFGYGRISAADPTVPGGDTIFEIGSITKAFTGTLLSLEGLALEDPIRKHLPADHRLPAKEITLLHLATHRSGLPRLPVNLEPKDATNPYADYGVEELYDGLGKTELLRDPGAAYEYSNLGMGLLGHILERKSGKSYERLVVDRICAPLKMGDTRITLSPDQKRRLAPGHPGPNWDLAALAGAGALRSTASDLLRFLEANVRGDYDAAHTPRADAGASMKIGLGWHLFPDVVWHNGGTGGYRSFAGFNRKTGTAVVVLANSTSDTDMLGFSLLNLLRDVQ